MTETSYDRQASMAHDVLGWQRQFLLRLFDPQSVALVGASEKNGSIGQALLENLGPGNYGGRFYPVNSAHATVGGLAAFKDLASLPEVPDLVVVATPAHTVPGLVDEAASKGVKNAIVISAGFKESGAQGVALERSIAASVARTGMRILGPNCLGLMRPPSGLNATFAKPLARCGSVAFLSQSGALLSSVLDWGLERGVGFSACVSLGSMLDLSWGDFFDYLGADPHTKSIAVYMESVGDARTFMNAAREVALAKPIIVLKAGRSVGGAQAAASHTGALSGSDDVLDAAFKRCGILRVDTIAELFNMTEALEKGGRPRGKRLAIVTNAGGPGVLATDALLKGGGELAPLTPGTLAGLSPLLPEHWSHANPVDVLGDAGPERYGRSLEAVVRDPNTDGVLVILTPQAMSDSVGTARAVISEATRTEKPVFASWIGGRETGKGMALLKAAGIPCFAYPDTAAGVFNHLWRYDENLRNLYETPTAVDDGSRHGRVTAADLIEGIRSEGRVVMTETESKHLLAAYGISVAETRVASSEEDAVAVAGEIGYPMVLKLNSLTITHKTDVGGVKLGLKDAEAVRRAYQDIHGAVTAKYGESSFQGVAVQPMLALDGYELILGASMDPQFGPVLLFGTGGQLVEVYKDRVLGLPPLNRILARRMMEGSKVYTALKGVRGRKAVDLARLEEIVVELSQLVLDHPAIKELDLNPLLAGPQGILALDARVILHPKDLPDEDLPKPAIRPYPSHYVKVWKTKYGREFVLRPIRPEDESEVSVFHENMAGLPTYQRYLSRIHLAEGRTHERFLRLCMNDFGRQITIVAEAEHQIAALARLTRLGEGEAEFALQVAEDARGQGLGRTLLAHLVAIAGQEGLRRLGAGIDPDEIAMREICVKLGFDVRSVDGKIVAVLDLKTDSGGKAQPR